MVRRTSVISKVFYQLLLNPDNPFQLAACSQPLFEGSLHADALDGVTGEGPRISHLPEVEEAHDSPGSVLHWKPQGPGQCCCPGSEPAAAPRGLAGTLPQLSCSSSSPGTSCLSHQPNTVPCPALRKADGLQACSHGTLPTPRESMGRYTSLNVGFSFCFP